LQAKEAGCKAWNGALTQNLVSNAEELGFVELIKLIAEGHWSGLFGSHMVDFCPEVVSDSENIGNRFPDFADFLFPYQKCVDIFSSPSD
jgi:hypothetical protein